MQKNIAKVMDAKTKHGARDTMVASTMEQKQAGVQKEKASARGQDE